MRTFMLSHQIYGPTSVNLAILQLKLVLATFTVGNKKVSGQLEISFAGITQRPLETPPGTIRII